MIDPWGLGQPATDGLAGGSITLVEGSSFAISRLNGDIEPGGSQGVFFEDTRFVSTWRLRIEGRELQSLASIPRLPFAATFVSRGQPQAEQSDSTLFAERSRYVGNGMREDLVLRNFGRDPVSCSMTFDLAADFAHLFEVKENRVRRRGDHSDTVTGSTMTFAYEDRGATRRLDVEFPPEASVTAGMAKLDVVVPAGGQWATTFEFRLVVDGQQIDLRYERGAPIELSTPVKRLREWESTAPRVHCDDERVNATFRQSQRDLGALRIFDPADPERAVIAAGAPWFMTLFGRDSLLSSLMTLTLDARLATSTLLTLARMQGVRSVDATEEQPGKILHEVRRGLTTVLDGQAGSVYYGSIDSTPLFVVLLGELVAWGLDDDTLAQLLPHADRALDWITRFGDRDGDGFVEYERTTERGLANQGWKDSFDGVSFADGRLAEAPIALCEVQGYVYAAWLARARIARKLGDSTLASNFEQRAAELKVAFNERFWLEESGYFAIGLDRDKAPIDSLTSNIGHCLFAGIVDEDKAARTAEHLCGPAMLSGWGVRTLATSMERYNPVSYHNGSVWPHDTAICAAGLARYGMLEEAKAVTSAILEAAEAFGGRLPELFCGFDRDAFPIPIPYPASCSPQAWASAAPFLLLQESLLRLRPSIPDGTVTCAPSVPAGLGTLVVDNLMLGGARVSITASGSTADLEGLSPHLQRS